MAASRLFIAVTVAVLMTGQAVADEAGRQQPGFDAALLPQLYEKIDTSKMSAELYEMCPAEIAGAQRSWTSYIFPSSKVQPDACAKDAVGCLEQCLDDANETACFAIGRVLEEYAPEDHLTYSQQIYAVGCALGDPASCTNRGAGLRNATTEAELRRSKPDLGACTFGAFEYACTGGSAWGCYMLGQAYKAGEGADKDNAAALKAYNKSCTINPNFVACDNAKRAITRLEEEQ